MNHILIVEDDTALSNGIVLALKDGNCSFIQAYDISAAKRQMRSNSFDLVILDVNLPDGNGLDLLADVRKTLALPVIVLTANDMETDIVTGFELGADDYITKPFSGYWKKHENKSCQRRRPRAFQLSWRIQRLAPILT